MNLIHTATLEISKFSHVNDEKEELGNGETSLNATVIPNLQDEAKDVRVHVGVPAIEQVGDIGETSINTTVITNLQNEAKDVRVDVEVPVATNPSEYMTRAECYQLLTTGLENLLKMKTVANQNDSNVVAFRDSHLPSDITTEVPDSNYDPAVDPDLLEDTIISTTSELIELRIPECASLSDEPNEDSVLIDSCDDSVLVNDASTATKLSFQFKVPEIPRGVPASNDRRRSLRIQQLKSNETILPSPRVHLQKLKTSELPSPQPIKRRRTTISKKKERQSIGFGVSVTKADHRKYVLDLLNKGDMKAIQMLPQIGMKTAYGIITTRSLNGKFRSFKDVAPSWHH